MSRDLEDFLDPNPLPQRHDFVAVLCKARHLSLKDILESLLNFSSCFEDEPQESDQ